MLMKRVTNSRGDWRKFLEGIRFVTRPVRSSIGYGGRTTIVQKPFTPIITKDGKGIANEIQLSKPLHRLGSDVVKMVLRKTDEKAKDSTSTSASIFDYIIFSGVRLIEEDGINPTMLTRGINKTYKYLMDELWKLTTPIKNEQQLKNIAHIASNSDRAISDQVFKAFQKAGEHNPVIMDEVLFGEKVEVKIEEGLYFDNGYMHPMFMTDPIKGTAEFKNVQVLLLTEAIASGEGMLDILELVRKYSGEPLLILTETVQGQALGQLIVARHPHLANIKANSFPVVPVKLPTWGGDRKYAIEDIALITGATPIGNEFGLNLASFDPTEHLGSAKNIVIYNNRTVITGGGGNKKDIKDKIAFLEKELKKKVAKRPLQERIQKLSGKVAVITPGAPTEIDAKEIRDRIEDCIGSVRTAKEHGYLAGGGTVLYRLAKRLLNPKFDLAKELKLTSQEEDGARLVIRSLIQPIKDNILNVGRKSLDDVLSEIDSKDNINVGYNGETNKIEDLVKAGVIDSAYGQITAIEMASSVASKVLSSDDLVIEDEDAENKGTPDNPFVS